MKLFCIFLSGLIFLLVGCSKNYLDSEIAPLGNKKTKLKIFLTDASCNYDSVLIDIQSLRIITSTFDTTLPVQNPGIYNLLDLNNGIDSLLVIHTMGSDTLKEIRLILGNQNSVVIDSIEYYLKTPSAQSSGLKVKINSFIQAGITYKLWLDFDACRSIVSKGNGGYNLKPVIRSYTSATSGSIHGVIKPDSAVTYLFAFNSTDTFGTVPGSGGSFQILGMDSGLYDIYFQADSFYNDSLIQAIPVNLGLVTDIDTIRF